MRNRLAVAVVLSALTWACAESSDSAVEPAAALFNAASIRADVRALSADDMEGRATGTPGEARAADWIESRFREIGLQPVNGAYRQSVRLVGMRRDGDASSLSITSARGALPLEDGVNVAFWSTAQEPVVQLDAPLLFVGYGVEAPEYGWDDFKGVDVTGKVLLFLNNDPPVSEDGVELFGGEARTYYGRWTYKLEQAMQHGAAGALMVHTTPSAS